MFGKKSFGSFAKKAYSSYRQSGVLEKNDFESMVDSTPFEEATETKVIEGNRHFEREAEKHFMELAKKEEEAKKLEYEKKRIEDEKRRQIEAEELKKKPILMDIDNAPSDKLLSEPIPEQRKKELPPVQLSTPLGKQKVYYTQIVKTE